MFWKPLVPPPPLPEDVKRRRDRRRSRNDRRGRRPRGKAMYVLAAIGAVTVLVLLARYAIVPLLVWLGGRT